MIRYVSLKVPEAETDRRVSTCLSPPGEEFSLIGTVKDLKDVTYFAEVQDLVCWCGITVDCIADGTQERYYTTECYSKMKLCCVGIFVVSHQLVQGAFNKDFP